jgi:hypothetical protein
LPFTDEDVTGKKNQQLRLAYKFDIYATNPVSRGDIYIDAVTGNSLFYNATIKHLGEYSHGAKRLVKLKIKYRLLLLLQMPRHVIVEIKPYKLHQVVGHISFLTLLVEMES